MLRKLSSRGLVLAAWMKCWCSSSSSWLRPRQTVIVFGFRLMSRFAALQRTVPPPHSPTPHADVEQLSTTAPPLCCRAINHPQLGRGRTEQRPLGMDEEHSAVFTFTEQPECSPPHLHRCQQNQHPSHISPSQLLPLIAFISVSMGAASRSNLLIMCRISSGPGAGMEHRGRPGCTLPLTGPLPPCWLWRQPPDWRALTRLDLLCSDPKNRTSDTELNRE